VNTALVSLGHDNIDPVRRAGRHRDVRIIGELPDGERQQSGGLRDDDVAIGRQNAAGDDIRVVLGVDEICRQEQQQNTQPLIETFHVKGI